MITVKNTTKQKHSRINGILAATLTALLLSMPTTAHTQSNVLKADQNWQIITQTITLQPNGDATGITAVKLTGKPAIIARELVKEIRKLPDEIRAQTVQYLLAEQGFNGTGKFTADDPSKGAGPFNMQVDYNITGFVSPNDTVDMELRPAVSLIFPIAKYFRILYENTTAKPLRCFNLRTEEEYLYHFPDNTKILSMPKKTSAESKAVRYSAEYDQTGTTIKAARSLTSDTPMEECKKEHGKTPDATAVAIAQDIAATISIRRPIQGMK